MADKPHAKPELFLGPLNGELNKEEEFHWARPPKAGDPCPRCQTALDYDGLLNLACLKCGYALGGCFT